MKRKLVILVLALQVAWVVGTVAVQETRLRSGVVVRLETEPVDPRDLLRGDYVILRYKISALPAALFTGTLPAEPPVGEAVYVRLEKRGAFHEAESASFEPLKGDAEHPVLRGRVSNPPWLSAGSKVIEAHFGLERYYVREGTGNPRGKLTVDVAVVNSGQGVIREVYLDGKPYAEAMKNEAR